MKKIDKDIDQEIAKLLGFADFKSIMTFDESKGVIYIGGERVDDSRLANLKSESEFVLNSELWKILMETIKHMAEQMMFVRSSKWEDLQSGKMWLYHLDIQKKLMEIFKRYKGKV